MHVLDSFHRFIFRLDCSLFVVLPSERLSIVYFSSFLPINVVGIAAPLQY